MLSQEYMHKVSLMNSLNTYEIFYSLTSAFNPDLTKPTKRSRVGELHCLQMRVTLCLCDSMA